MSGLAHLPLAAGARVLAVGAWLKNAACHVDGHRLRWSPLHGDLDDPEHCAALEHSVRALTATARVDAVAHDLHPDFFSTRLALQVAERLGVPAVAVQHHHAHIGVACAEFGVRDPVIGLALDGVGLGTDGAAWGGELLLVDGCHWTRLGHLQALALAGGDTAAREPWRLAASVLHLLGRSPDIPARFGPVVGERPARTVQAMLMRGLNCPPSTAAGRWFDAAAGALGISIRQAAEAEAAMALERAATAYLARHQDPYEPGLYAIDDTGVLDLRPLLARLFSLAEGVPARQDYGAALFHVTLAQALAEWAAVAAARHGVRQVALGGGCFFNQLMTARLRSDLERQGLHVVIPAAVSCGDAGLALGQAWVAAHQLDVHRETAGCASQYRYA